jgi:hypothetical protein
MTGCAIPDNHVKLKCAGRDLNDDDLNAGDTPSC